MPGEFRERDHLYPGGGPHMGEESIDCAGPGWRSRTGARHRMDGQVDIAFVRPQRLELLDPVFEHLGGECLASLIERIVVERGSVVGQDDKIDRSA
jgi:hypothetical protein